MNIKKFWILLVCLAFFAISFTASSKEVINLVTGEYRPYTSEKLEQYGMLSEVVTTVIRRMGMDVSYNFAPWKRCEKMIEQQKTLAALPYAMTEGRREKYYFSDSLFTNKAFLWYYRPRRDHSSFKYTTYADLKKYNTIGISGYWYMEKLKNAGVPKKNILLAMDEFTSVKQLMKGRGDFFIHDPIILLPLLRKHFPEEEKNFVKVKNQIRESGLYLIFSKKNKKAPGFIEKFNKALKEAKEDGTYDKIIKKWMGQL